MQLVRNGTDLHHDAILKSFAVFGNAGVDLFFVISGFIMVATTWNLLGSGRASVSFILNRIARIYPAYYLALLPVVGIFVFKRDSFMTGHSLANTDVLASIFLYPQPLHKVLLGISWTLVWEMTFYIVFALMMTQPREKLPWLLAS
jgi:peptidoglycan/LPS O-acetylase OafA/YrhL